jgi:hypothetical protein
LDKAWLATAGLPQHFVALSTSEFTHYSLSIKFPLATHDIFFESAYYTAAFRAFLEQSFEYYMLRNNKHNNVQVLYLAVFSS